MAKKSIKNFIIVIGGQGTNRVLGLIASVLIARMLGPEEFGSYSLFLTVFLLIYQARAGVNITYVKFAKSSEGNNKKKFLKVSTTLQLIISGLLILLGWPVSLLLAHVVSFNHPSFLFFSFLCGGCVSFLNIWFGVFQEKEDFGKLAMIVPVFNFCVVLLLFCIWFLVENPSVMHVIAVYLIAGTFLGAISGIILKIILSSSRFEKIIFADMFRMTSKNIGISLCFFLFRTLDVFFIKYFLDLEAVGTYSAAVRTAMILNLFVSAMPTILLPKAIKCFESDKGIRNYFLKSYSLAGGLVLVFIGFYIMSPYILAILYGQEYVEAASILKVLVGSWCFSILYIPIMQIFYAMNKSGSRLIIELFRLLLASILFIYLIPKMGVIGAAWSLLISVGVTLLVASIFSIYFIKNHRMDSTSF